MNYLLGLIPILLLLLSCAGNDPVNNKRAILEKKIIPSLNNPSSYEFAELKVVDSVTNRENLEKMKQQINSIGTGSMTDWKRINWIDSVLTSDNKTLDSICAYIYYLDFRATNKFGGTVLERAYCYLTPSDDIIHFAFDPGKVPTTSNMMKEYKEFSKNVR